MTVGQRYTLSAAVTGGGPVPATGSVQFTSAGGATAVGTLSGGTPDVATTTVAAPDTAGLVTWQAEYQGDAGTSGDPGDAPSNSPSVGESVSAAPTSTTLKLSKDPLTTGQRYTATATVAGTGPKAPTGYRRLLQHREPHLGRHPERGQSRRGDRHHNCADLAGDA